LCGISSDAVECAAGGVIAKDAIGAVDTPHFVCPD
jgi:hypothetical protein